MHNNDTKINICKTNEHTVQEDTISNLYPCDLKPVCVKIINVDDHVTDATSYNAELYTGNNDGYSQHNLTNINTDDDRDSISTSELYTSINIAQIQDSTQNTFSLKDLMSHDTAHVLKIKMNLNQQMDSGANKNVTNNEKIVRNFVTIKPIPIFGVGNSDAACYITAKGITTLLILDGSHLDIQMYFSNDCSGTIISPNAVVRDSRVFTSWTQTSHLDTGTAEIQFYHRTDFTQNKTLLMHMNNDLWFINQSYNHMIKAANKSQVCTIHDDPAISPFLIHKLDKLTEYELWHQRLMHPGHTTMEYIDKCTVGIPHLHRHPMRNCKICHEMNITKTSSKQPSKILVSRFAEQFQMDFGFMSAKQGSEFIKSHDGYNCYLLIVDLFTRYLWIFLSKNKHPPLQTIRQFLRTYGLRRGVRVIRTDQGGE